MQFADRLNNVETSAIRELFKLLGKPGIISFAGGFPDSAMFDVQGIREASEAALTQEPGAALQYGATEGYNPLREQLAAIDTLHKQWVIKFLNGYERSKGVERLVDAIGKILHPQEGA
jgi:DNA-binding transcriptional MocR family regulator